jgi:hypothetical protein
MIKLAAKANIPIISITSNDPINVELVLSDTLKSKVLQWIGGSFQEVSKLNNFKQKYEMFDYFFTLDPDFTCDDALYNWLVSKEKVLFLVNHSGSPYSFQAGELTASLSLINSVISGVVSDQLIDTCLPILKGLSIKGVSELIRLASANGDLSPRSLLNLRHHVSVRASGLESVDKELGVYFPNSELKEYVDLNLPYFTVETPLKLRPRGVLLYGVAGCGKSLASKYIANRLDVPLFRLDLSASLSRYVGSSEQNMSKILSSVKNESCVLLIDEVEKLFGESDDSGVTYRILAQLLWFLQEHKDLVITVMTSNNISKLPPELYRHGRIDTVIKLTPMSIAESHSLISALLIDLGVYSDTRFEEAKAIITPNYKDQLTPASITSETYKLVKKHLWLV